MEFNFGDIVKDKFTDLEGLVVGKVEYFNGCKKLAIQVRELKDGKIRDYEWLDVQQVILVKSAPPVEVEPKGGPMQTP